MKWVQIDKCLKSEQHCIELSSQKYITGLRNTNQQMREIKLLLCDWKFNIERSNLEDQKMITHKLYKIY